MDDPFDFLISSFDEIKDPERRLASLLTAGPGNTPESAIERLKLLVRPFASGPNSTVEEFHFSSHSAFFKPTTEQFRTQCRNGYQRAWDLNHRSLDHLQRWANALHSVPDYVRPFAEDLCSQYRCMLFDIHDVQTRDAMRLSKDTTDGDLAVLKATVTINQELSLCLGLSDKVLIRIREELLRSMDPSKIKFGTAMMKLHSDTETWAPKSAESFDSSSTDDDPIQRPPPDVHASERLKACSDSASSGGEAVSMRVPDMEKVTLRAAESHDGVSSDGETSDGDTINTPEGSEWGETDDEPPLFTSSTLPPPQPTL